MVPEPAPLNPDFIRFRQEADVNKDFTTSTEGYKTGVIPAPKKLWFPEQTSGKLKQETELPSIYDLRILGKVTSVKNQDGCSTCWAFGSCGSIESDWKVLGLPDNDLSENNMKNCHHFDFDPCSGGGQSWMVISYFSRLAGPVPETSDPYVGATQSCTTGITPVAYPINARLLPNNQALLKQTIMDYGAIYTVMYWISSCYNSSYYTYYYSGSHVQNHGICIVGWDDTKVTAGGTGAWIIKNSWGTSWGESGYFYVSYNDAKINAEVCYYPSKVTTNSTSRMYMYDDFGEYADIGYGAHVGYGLVKFTTTNSNPITRVSTWIASGNGTLSNGSVDIEIYDDFNGTTLSNLLISMSGLAAPYPGFYTFDLPTPLSLGNNNDFYIKVKYTTPDYNYPIPVEEKVSGYSSNAIIETGVCWISYDGTSWTAIGTGTSYLWDLCIQAYSAVEPLPPVTTAGNISAYPGSSVSIPLTVENFTSITSLKLLLEFDPTKMTYSSSGNLNPDLTGLTVEESVVSESLHQLIVRWTGNTAVTLTAGGKLFDLNFNYISGNGTLSFNNLSNQGKDCSYSDALRSPIYDYPTASYYHNSQVSSYPTLSGQSDLCQGAAGIVYETEAGMSGYTWNVSSGGMITAGGNSSSNSVTVTWHNAGPQTVSVNYTNLNGVTAPVPTVKNIIVNPATAKWTGTASSDWNQGANWDATFPPGACTDVTVPASTPKGIIITGSAICHDLIIESGANLLGNANLTVNGISTIKREITGSTNLNNYKYHLVSIPLVASTNPTTNLFLDSYLYEYDVAGNSWTSLGTSTTTPLDVTKGYMIYYPGASKTYEFTGPLNFGAFNPTVINAGSGFNLVPNPYPSAVDWDAASGWTKTNIANSIWIWPSGGSNYTSYINGVGTNGGTQYIPSCQAFFVQATGNSPVLTMTDEVRVHNNQPFWKDANSISNLLRIKVDANSCSDEAIVRFEEGSTVNFDPNFDAFKMMGLTNAPQLYTMSQDEKQLSINSLPVTISSAEVKLEFSLGVNADAVFTITGTESFNPNTRIFLDDLLKGTTTNLKQQNSYTFQHNTGNNPYRFKLRFNGVTGIAETPSETQSMWIYNDKLYINAPQLTGKDVHIEIFNMIGQQLFNQTVVLNEITVVKPGIQGMVIVRLTSDAKVITLKGFFN
ncbi:MAG: C1 family peptidase [Bacteroidales bacterium]